MALLAECPVCRRPLHWTYVLRPMWSQWRCGACGSLLTVGKGRRLLAILPFVAIALALMWTFQSAGWGYPVALLAILVVWLPYFLLVDRPVVLERCGLRCKQCGYDLRGQVLPRCPECSRELDEAERAMLESGVFATAPAVRRRPWLLPGVLISVALLICVVQGLVCYRMASSRAARRRAITAQQLAPRASQPSTTQPSATSERAAPPEADRPRRLPPATQPDNEP